jgi:hypothetical protein
VAAEGRRRRDRGMQHQHPRIRTRGETRQPDQQRDHHGGREVPPQMPGHARGSPGVSFYKGDVPDDPGEAEAAQAATEQKAAEPKSGGSRSGDKAGKPKQGARRPFKGKETQTDLMVRKAGQYKTLLARMPPRSTIVSKHQMLKGKAKEPRLTTGWSEEGYRLVALWTPLQPRQREAPKHDGGEVVPLSRMRRTGTRRLEMPEDDHGNG